jgi:hypothetical protein
MVYLLKPLMEKAAVKLKKIEPEGVGRCVICGRFADTATSRVKEWLRNDKNVGILKSISEEMPVCVECAEILVSGIASSYRSAVNPEAGVFVSGYTQDGTPVAEGLVFESADECREFLNSLGIGRYVFLAYLKTGKYLPVNDLVKLQATTNPAVSVAFNFITGTGTTLQPQVIPTPVLFEEKPNFYDREKLYYLRKKLFQGGKK